MARIQQAQLQESMAGMVPTCHIQSATIKAAGAELTQTSLVHQHWGISCLPFLFKSSVGCDALLGGCHSISPASEGNAHSSLKELPKQVPGRMAKALQSWNGNKYLQLFLQSSLVLIK